MDVAIFGSVWLLTAHIAVAALIVLVMRMSSPVWGGRAAKASWIGVVVTFLLTSTGDIPIPYQIPMGLLGTSAVVVAATGLGSSMSKAPPPETVRRATLAPRRLFVSRVPRQRLALVVASTVAMGTSAIAALTATGATLVHSHRGASGVAQDYPGRSGGGWFLVTAALVLILTWWALRQIEDRPRVEEPHDTVMRVRDASRVLRATTFAMSASGAILLFSVGSRMNEATQLLRVASTTAPRSPWDFYQWTAFALYIPAVVLIFVALFALGGSISTRETLESLGQEDPEPRLSGQVQSGATR